MKRYGLLLATIAMLLLTGGVLHKTKWFLRPTRDTMPGRAHHARSADPLENSAGWRYRQNQPHLGRYCLLHN